MADYLSVCMSTELLRKVLVFVGDDAWFAQTACWTLRSCQPAAPACRCCKCNYARTQCLVTNRCRKHRRVAVGAECVDCGSVWDTSDCIHIFPAPSWTAVSSIERYQWVTQSLGWPQRFTAPAAAALGRLDVLELAFDHLPEQAVRDSVLLLAGMSGNTDIIDWAVDHGCEWHFEIANTVCGAATERGHLDVVRLALGSQKHIDFTNHITLAVSISDGAAAGGHVELLVWAHDNELLCVNYATRTAARRNRRVVLDWLISLETGVIFQDTSVCAEAARGGHLELLAYLRECGFAWNERTCSEAIRGGHLDVLRFARTHGCPWTSRVLAEAATDGDPKMLRWMYENGCEPDLTACVTAACCGRLANLQYLMSLGVAPSVDLYRNAAHNGHRAVLEWLMRAYPEEEMRQNIHICAAAAGGGHLELLTWLREQDYAWDWHTCVEAVSGGHLDVLQFARSKGCPWFDWVLDHAARHGDPKMLRWMCENKCVLDPEACASAARWGKLDNLQCLRSLGVAWSPHVCSAAATGGHLPTLQWAHANGCPWTHQLRSSREGPPGNS